MKKRPTLTNEKPSALNSAIVPDTASTNKRMLNFAFGAFDLAMDAATVVALIWILVEVLR